MHFRLKAWCCEKLSCILIVFVSLNGVMKNMKGGKSVAIRLSGDCNHSSSLILKCLQKVLFDPDQLLQTISQHLKRIKKLCSYEQVHQETFIKKKKKRFFLLPLHTIFTPIHKQDTIFKPVLRYYSWLRLEMQGNFF